MYVFKLLMKRSEYSMTAIYYVQQQQQPFKKHAQMKKMRTTKNTMDPIISKIR